MSRYTDCDKVCQCPQVKGFDLGAGAYQHDTYELPAMGQHRYLRLKAQSQATVTNMICRFLCGVGAFIGSA